MPNQRSRNKVRLGGFVDRKLYREVMASAKNAGMENNKFGFAQQLIREALTARLGRPRATAALSTRHR